MYVELDKSKSKNKYAFIFHYYLSRCILPIASGVCTSDCKAEAVTRYFIALVWLHGVANCIICA